jgi:hypothetical protein
LTDPRITLVLIEDDPDDAELVAAIVRDELPDVDVVHVDDERAFRRALRRCERRSAH